MADQLADQLEQWVYKHPQEEWFNARINMHCRVSDLGIFETVLAREGVIRRWEEGIFGKLMCLRQQLFSGKLCLNLLCREIVYPKAREDEMWFKVGGCAIRFGKEEFLLVTGLRFGPLPEGIASRYRSAPGSVHHRYFSGSPTNIEDIMHRMSNGCGFEHEDDLLKLGYVYFVSHVMLGRDYRWAVPNALWGMVEDVQVFESFPWGTYIYSSTLFWLGRALSGRTTEKKQIGKGCSGKRGVGINIYGFPWALMFWAMEAIPALTGLVGVRRGDVIPRIRRWHCMKKPYHLEKQFTDDLEAYSTLTPSDEERGAEYYVHFDPKQLVGPYLHKRVDLYVDKKYDVSNVGRVRKRGSRVGVRPSSSEGGAATTIVCAKTAAHPLTWSRRTLTNDDFVTESESETATGRVSSNDRAKKAVDPKKLGVPPHITHTSTEADLRSYIDNKFRELREEIPALEARTRTLINSLQTDIQVALGGVTIPPSGMEASDDVTCSDVSPSSGDIHHKDSPRGTNKRIIDMMIDDGEEDERAMKGHDQEGYSSGDSMAPTFSTLPLSTRDPPPTVSSNKGIQFQTAHPHWDCRLAFQIDLVKPEPANEDTMNYEQVQNDGSRELIPEMDKRKSVVETATAIPVAEPGLEPKKRKVDVQNINTMCHLHGAYTPPQLNSNQFSHPAKADQNTSSPPSLSAPLTPSQSSSLAAQVSLVSPLTPAHQVFEVGPPTLVEQHTSVSAPPQPPSPSLGEAQAFFAELKCILDESPNDLLVSSRSIFTTPEEIDQAKHLLQQCLSMNFELLVHPSRRDQLNSSLELLLEAGCFSSCILNLVRSFHTNFLRNIDKYSNCHEHIKRADKNKEEATVLRGELANNHTCFNQIMGDICVVNEEIEQLLKHLEDKKKLKIALEAQTKDLVESSKTSKDAYARCLLNSKKLQKEEQNSEKVLADIDALWDAFRTETAKFL